MKTSRRDFLRVAAAGAAAMAAGRSSGAAARRPNIVFVFADEWRAQAFGYAGDPNVRTPNLDRLAAESVHVTHAISNCPVCSPYRASLLTGRYPLSHGVFLNDVHLADAERCMGEIFRDAGYDTAYIGKWHLDGRGRSAFTPPESRQGFGYWKALECTHAYNRSLYYAGDSPEPETWEGYDAAAQTRDAIARIRAGDGSKPFLLVLSWGPPHDPYDTAPERYRALYDPAALKLRPNVPPEMEAQARGMLYDNEADPFQQKNLVNDPAHAKLRDELDARLRARLGELKDEFLPGAEYVRRRGYPLDATGTVPYKP